MGSNCINLLLLELSPITVLVSFVVIAKLPLYIISTKIKTKNVALHPALRSLNIILQWEEPGILGEMADSSVWQWGMILEPRTMPESKEALKKKMGAHQRNTGTSLKESPVADGNISSNKINSIVWMANPKKKVNRWVCIDINKRLNKWVNEYGRRDKFFLQKNSKEY